MKEISLPILDDYVSLTLDYQATWHWLSKHWEKYPRLWEEDSSDWELIQSIAKKIPEDYKFAPHFSYRIDKEVGFDPREGPEYEFEKFLDEVKSIWKLSGIANFDLTMKANLWKEFSTKHPIAIWALSRWQYSQLDPKNIFYPELFKNLLGISLSHIKPTDTALLKIFQNKSAWSHWNYLEWQWLWGDDPRAVLPWIELLEGQNIRSLSLKHMKLGVPGFKTLGRLKSFWEDLESLTLNQVYLGEDEITTVLDENPKFNNLKYFHWDDSPISNGGKPVLEPRHFVSLIKSGWFDRLERLHLYYHTMGKEGLQALGESSAIETLRYLRLGVGGMGDEDLLLLASFPWKKLNYISLSYNSKITTEGLDAFQKTRLYENCRYVFIQNTNGKSLNKGSLFL